VEAPAEGDRVAEPLERRPSTPFPAPSRPAYSSDTSGLASVSSNGSPCNPEFQMFACFNEKSLLERPASEPLNPAHHQAGDAKKDKESFFPN